MTDEILKAVDTMGFAGSFGAGVDQAGFDIISKREPSAFKGFGVESHNYNMPWMEAQVSEPDDWALPPEPVELLYGCPPCSGFSNLSHANVTIHGATYGSDAPINECMVWWADYAARVKPRIAIMESVGPAFTAGRDWVEGIWQRLVERSGLPYQLTHVNHDVSMLGGDVNRRRYFLVAHLDPFGVGLEFVTPCNAIDVIGDLSFEEDEDNDWGHQTLRDSSTARTEKTIAWLEEQGLEWRPGTRLPNNTGAEIFEGKEVGFDDGSPALEPPDFWMKPTNRDNKPSKRAGYRPDVYSHWHSTDMFSVYRWKPDKPFGVIVAASLDRAVHPTAPRNITYREAARFMSLPDTWSLRSIVDGKKSAEMGKAVTSAAGKWIAHWARQSVLGTPGEYAGRATADPDVRVITVNTPRAVEEIMKGNPDDEWWTETSDPSPSAWIIDRKARPDEWWQREDELGLFVPKAKTLRAPKEPKAPAAPRATGPTKAPSARNTTVRVNPEVVAAVLAELGMSKPEAAAKLGVSTSRIYEIAEGHSRPGSWLAEGRWPDIEARLRA